MKVSIGIIEGKEVTLDCSHYDNLDCGNPRFRECPKNEPLCCVHCSDHYACFTHAWIGCMSADQSKMAVWGGMDDSMWVNENRYNHCPMQGHG